MNYSYTKKINLSFFEALDEVRLAFAEKGFGVVSNVNVAEKIRKNTNPNFGEYTILGLCHPELAYKYLSENMDLGVFMPCSVAIYEKDNGVFVSAGLVDVMISGIVESSNIMDLSKNVSKLMKEVIDSI